MRGTDPPRCVVHRTSLLGDGGSVGPVGPPPGSTNAQPGAVYAGPPPAPDDTLSSPGQAADIDARIADLNHRIEQLSHYIDDVQPRAKTPPGSGIGPPDCTGGSESRPYCIDLDQYTRLLSLHGQLTSRFGRLLRDKQQIAPDEVNPLQQAILDALDQAGDILGVKL